MQKSLIVLMILVCFSCNNSEISGKNEDVLTFEIGTFLDSQVSGLVYETPTLYGITDERGQFQYKPGESITFSIGDIILGKTEGGEIITPLELISDASDCTHWTVTNIARLLQTLDEDDNIQNGITISEATRSLALGVDIDLSGTQNEFENDLSNFLDLIGLNNKIVDISTAQKHLEATIEGLRNEDSIYFDKDTYLQIQDNLLINKSNGLSIENFYDYDFPLNEEKSIYSKVQDHKAPEVFIQDKDKDIEQVTNNDFIEISPVINNKGDFAYALSEYSTSQTKLYLNGNLISDPEDDGLFNHLAINDTMLLCAYEDYTADSHHLLIYNLSTKSFTKIAMPGFIQKINPLNENIFLVQVFNLSKMSLDVYKYDQLNSLSPVADSGDNEFYFVHKDGSFRIDTIKGDGDALLLFYALHLLKEYQTSNPFAYSNNFLSRISWNASYILEGLIKLYQRTSCPIFKELAIASTKAILNSTNGNILSEVKELPDFLWATKKYSIDKDIPIDLLVDDALIIYPLLIAVNGDFFDAEVKDQIIDLAEKSFEYFEPYYNQQEQLYHIQYGINYSFDGVWAPFNWQNSFGLVLIELFKATQDVKYKERAEALAQKFRSEWVETSDGRILWHYWPSYYYSGWSENDNISLNTPERPATTDILFEDVGHAGMNLSFIFKYRKFIGNNIFTDEDIEKINKAADGMIFDDVFSGFISGDTSYYPPKYLYLPTYGWTELENDILYGYYCTYLPVVNPDFNNMGNIVIYLDAIQGNLDNAQITISSTYYKSDFSKFGSSSMTKNEAGILSYFDLCGPD